MHLITQGCLRQGKHFNWNWIDNDVCEHKLFRKRFSDTRQAVYLRSTSGRKVGHTRAPDFCFPRPRRTSHGNGPRGWGRPQFHGVHRLSAANVVLVESGRCFKILPREGGRGDIRHPQDWLDPLDLLLDNVDQHDGQGETTSVSRHISLPTPTTHLISDVAN